MPRDRSGADHRAMHTHHNFKKILTTGAGMLMCISTVLTLSTTASHAGEPPPLPDADWDFDCNSGKPHAGIHLYNNGFGTVDFLVTRSKTFVETNKDHDPRNVPVVRPGFNEPAIVTTNAPAGKPQPGQTSAA